MMSPLLLHQVVDQAHRGRLAAPRVGRSVVARVVANLHQVVWRAEALVATGCDHALPAWLGRLSDCVDEPQALTERWAAADPRGGEPAHRGAGR
jgi:hypothetical protein